MATSTRHPETLVDDPGIWFGIATGLVIVTFLIAGLAGIGATATAVAVIIVGGLCAARLSAPVAVGLGIVAWAFYTGFTENQFGQLTFAPGDLARLGAFALATACLAGVARRAVQDQVASRG